MPLSYAKKIEEFLKCEKKSFIFYPSFVRVIYKGTGFEEYLSKSKKKKYIRNYRNLAQRYLERPDPITFEIVKDVSGFNEIVSISEKSWKAKKGTHIGSVKKNEYYRNTVQYFAEKGDLRIFLLKHNGNAIAYVLCVMVDGCGYFLKADFDEIYTSFKVGNVLWVYVLEHMLDHEPVIKKLDFVSDFPYLQVWTSDVDAYATLYVFNETLIGKLLFFLMAKVKPCLKKIFKK
jgi:hypothetical protein